MGYILVSLHLGYIDIHKNYTLKTESCLIIRILHLGRMYYDPVDLSENRFQKECVFKTRLML